MKPWELFRLIYRKVAPNGDRIRYITVGQNLDYQIYPDLKNRVCYILFQQTSGFRDWVANLRFLPRSKPMEKYCDAWVHGGHLRVWRSGAVRILSDIIDCENSWPGFELVVAGFSKGASMALLCALAYRSQTGKRLRFVGFGGAKLTLAGSRATVMRAVARGSMNWINRSDLITTLPPAPFVHAWKNVVNRRFNPLDLVLNVRREHEIYERREIYP